MVRQNVKKSPTSGLNFKVKKQAKTILDPHQSCSMQKKKNTEKNHLMSKKWPFCKGFMVKQNDQKWPSSGLKLKMLKTYQNYSRAIIELKYTKNRSKK